MPGALEGVRIFDMSSSFMGPFATLLLAEMGAEVIEVESPARYTTRGVGLSRHDGMAAIFLHLNRNKRSLCLDFKTTEGIEVLKGMARVVDVVVSSLRPAAVERLGLSYELLSEENPGLVYCSVYGFGEGGQYAGKPAYDDLIQAAVGMPYLQSKNVGDPKYVSSAIADRIVGMYAAIAIAAAVAGKERAGVGQKVDVLMFEPFAHFVKGDHLYGHSFVPSIGTSGTRA
ncbi:CoA transferase [Brevibacterium sp. VCM10]|uniref:CoA transferase n=1 Tax=Brevibacterium sp. VCM10 TaxID=1381751 RepID=UPI0004B220E3|nr:CoA transferase [Brevibacterium sp. VCM10]